AEQIALDDALVAPANRLKIGKSNFRLSSDLKSKEATLQVVYDVLILTPFYKAFQISVDVPEIYMQEFWATAIVHHHLIRFNMNNKKHIVNLEYFREMLQICPKLPDQQFEELPFKEEILTFLRDLGHSEEIKVITNVNVNKLHQPWRSFAAVINKCLSAKNKNAKWSNEMYYPRFTKVIVNFFMTKDSSISRRNRVNWHFTRDDPMFTTIKVVSRHEDTQLYGAIFLNELSNKAIKDSESYKEYYAIALGAKPPKTKASVKKKQTGSNKTKTPLTAKGKRLKTSAKAAKPAKKKQPVKTSKAKGLIVLSKVALTEAGQMELATKRSLIQTHSSHTSGSGIDEGTGNIPGVPDIPTYESDDEQISSKSGDEEDDDEVAMSDHDDEVAMSDDDDDDADNQDDDDDQNDNNTDNENDDNDDDDGQDHEDLRVQTPSQYVFTDDDESNEVTHGANVEGEELDEEETNEEDEANELYRDVNVNLEGRDTEMTDAPRTIIQTTQVIEDTHVIITSVNPKGIDSIFNLNTESTSLVDVLVTTIVEPPLLSATILPPPSTPLITHLQQTPVPTPATVPSSSLQDLSNFGSLFGFDHRLKTLETNFSKFKQTNQFTVAVS
ncbi:ribonuclease H-like domain-containing protein, partial [Tanacetum coccineum]